LQIENNKQRVLKGNVLSIRHENTRVFYFSLIPEVSVKKKMTLTDAKTLGGVGSILILLIAVPTVGWILGIAGIVMVIIAINKISQEINDSKIKRNMLVAIALTIGAAALGAVTALGTLYRLLGMGSFVGTSFVLSPGITTGDWIGVAAVVVGGLAGVCAFLVASGVFVRRSYNSMASKLNVKMFGTAGLLYLIGVATAVVGVGFVLILVSEILLAVSFFSIPDQRIGIASQPQL
jgi:uncharacterized membrane protein